MNLKEYFRAPHGIGILLKVDAEGPKFLGTFAAEKVLGSQRSRRMRAASSG
jgi:hypothetical protein